MVRYENNADAALGEAAHRFEQGVDVGSGQRCRWLVEHQDGNTFFGVLQSTGNGYTRAGCSAQGGNRGTHVDVETQFEKSLLGPLGFSGPVDAPAKGGVVPKPESKVFHSADGLNEAKVLVHKANTGFVGSYCTAHGEVVAAHGDHKVGVWLVKTGQNLNKGALTRAILAYQSMYFAFFNVECDVIEGHLAGKSL